MNLYNVIVRNIGENKHILLVGDGGAGKTYQFTYAYKNIANMSINNNMIIPLYIPMNEFNNTKNFIRDYIISEYIGETEMVENVIAHNKLKDAIEKKDYRFCIFIDSIDETSTLTGEALSEIRELSKWKNVTIIFSCRNNIEHLPNFEVYKISPLNDELLEKEVEDYHTLNTKLKDLIKIPFYYKKYIEIKKGDKKNITSEAELLTLYYEWILEKTYESVDSNTYHDECDLLLNEFLPAFAYEQMTKIFYMLFDCVEINKLWNVFKKDYGINIIDNCIDVLEKFGVICKNGRTRYSFTHQNIHNYFAAKYIVNEVEEHQEKGDRLLNQVSDVYILTMIGELLGEHRYIHKCNCNEGKSPVEEKLDKYRGHFEDNLSPKMVDKYTQIMKLCRENRCCADLSNLNLVKTTLYEVDWSGSDFSSSVFLRNSFKNPLSFCGACDGNIVYYDEKNKVIVFTDLKKIIMFDNWFNVINTIDFSKVFKSLIEIYCNGMIIAREQKQLTYNFETKDFVNEFTPEKLQITIDCKNGKVVKAEDIINPKDFFMCDIYDNDYQLWEGDAYQHKDNKYKIFHNETQIALGIFKGEFENATINVESLNELRFSPPIENELLEMNTQSYYIDSKFYYESSNIVCVESDFFDINCKKNIRNFFSNQICVSYISDLNFINIIKEYVIGKNEEKKLVESETFKKFEDEETYKIYTNSENICCFYNADGFTLFTIDECYVNSVCLSEGYKIILGSMNVKNKYIIFLTTKDCEVYYNVYSFEKNDHKCICKSIKRLSISSDEFVLLEFDEYVVSGGKFCPSLHMNDKIIIYNDFTPQLKIYSFSDDKNYVLNPYEYGIYGIIRKFQLNSDSIIIDSVYGTERFVSKIEFFVSPRLNFEKKWTIQLLDNISIVGCNFDNCKILDFNGEIKNIPEELLFNT